MSGTLPEYLDLTRASQDPVRFTGDLSLVALRRLSTALRDANSKATVELQVFDEGGQAVVRGHVQTILILTCERCFGSLKIPVVTVFHLAWIRREEDAVQLPELYEPLVSATGRVKLAEVIEDELLLTLPMVALHEPSQQCSKLEPRGPPRHEKAGQATSAKPFAALKALKRR